MGGAVGLGRCGRCFVLPSRASHPSHPPSCCDLGHRSLSPLSPSARTMSEGAKAAPKAAPSTGEDEDFKRFRSWVALQRVVDPLSEAAWAYYDYGPRTTTPLVMLPGLSGTADVFFRQFLSLCPKGYRLISVRWPPFSVHSDWIKAFDRFLDSIGVKEVHLFGTVLGGYMAQLYLQHRPARVKTLILCNTFSDTAHFAKQAPCVSMIPYMPSFVLQQYVLKQYPEGENEIRIANSIDFMVNQVFAHGDNELQVESLTQHELASRLLLQCTSNPLKPTNFERVDTSHVTIIDVRMENAMKRGLGLAWAPVDYVLADVLPYYLHLKAHNGTSASLHVVQSMDEVSFPEKLRDDVQKYFPDARVAPLKTGGNFPYIARADEFNMHLVVHMRHHGVNPAAQTEQAPEDDAAPSGAATSGAE